MLDLIEPLKAKIIIALIIGSVVAILYFFLDIFFFLTGKHFGRMNIYLIHFTRNEFEKPPEDTMNSRLIGSKLSIQDDIYKNRWLFWRMIFVGLKATLDCPVLDFGKGANKWLMPIRSWFVSNRTSASELKRANGFPFKEEKYTLTVVYDLSDEGKRSRVLKAYLIRSKDLKSFQSYLERPPKSGKNFELFKKIAQAYKDRKGSFVTVMITAA
ncbi:MAG TPA: hypothetical protein VGE35_02525 [Candidatus Paceibacterota bacterium]